MTMVFPVSQTRMTGMPASSLFGSSSAAGFTVSLAPTTSVTSNLSMEGFTSSISLTMSYGTPASARRTLSWPGMRPATGWTAISTSLPFARSNEMSSAIEYCPLATARPYPGTMSTLSALTRSAAAALTSHTTHSPVSMSQQVSTAAPAPGLGGDLIARRTETMLRFIASHMIKLRMAPEEPMRAPTMVRSWLPSTKPSAQSAQPL
mmetsp:Transcript_20826/g.67444  ORF Transcript_20826/g.67444 Transcript_20826/m.67444 type:complete len:206 (+) Transcript_20826:272-889(+)